jgi:hypothetical protein
MKKKSFAGKLRFSKATLQTLKQSDSSRIKGGTNTCDTNADSVDVCVMTAYVCSNPCYLPSVSPGGCSGPTASLITRCATGGLCIPTYTCIADCIA